MKAKTKILTMVEIAVVLCSLFLVAIPAIAAEQTLQKASTTTSEDDYVLDIYGNANEDDTIDMGDVVYTKLAIFGKKPKTELCDAKYDGRINVLDVIQTKLIILGKEKELTIVQNIGSAYDVIENPVTISKPVERIVVVSQGEHAEALRILDAMDKVVGVSDVLINREYVKAFYPEFQDVANIGHYIDYEAVLSVNPDVVIAYLHTGWKYPEIEEHLPGVTVLRYNFYIGWTMFDEMRQLGYVLDNREEAQKYIDFVEGYENIVKEKVETLSEDEKPKVYIEGAKWRTYNKYGAPAYQLRMAGCRNIAEDIENVRQIDPEYVIEQNPDIIIKKLGWSSAGGYGADDPGPLEDAIAEIMSRPEFAQANAVQNEKVYVITTDINYHPSMIVSTVYLAKWFHPDLFKDLDPQAIHQEYLDTFHESLNWNVYEQGIFVYPPI